MQRPQSRGGRPAQARPAQARPAQARPATIQQPAGGDRPLPHNPGAEREILGAILLDNHVPNGALADAMQHVRSEDFFLPLNQLVFGAMIQLSERSCPIGIVTLHDHLERLGQLERLGPLGGAHLSELYDGTPRVTDVTHYARIVKEKADLRRVIHAAAAIQEQASSAADDADVIIERLVGMLSEIRSDRGSASGPRSYPPKELITTMNEAVDCIAHPFAFRGMVSLLDGPPKSAGKTTMLMTAADACIHERLFLNRATKRVPILFVTEENPRTIAMALNRAGLGDLTEWLHIVPATEFAGMPWPALAQWIERECIRLGIGWLIIDTFFAVAGLSGEQENQAGTVDEAVGLVRRIAGRLDIPITLTRHERKSGGDVGVSGRGSSALTGAVDIVMLLKRVNGGFDEARQLEIAGRVEQARFEIELRDCQYRIVGGGDHVSTSELADLVAFVESQKDGECFKETIKNRKGFSHANNLDLLKTALERQILVMRGSKVASPTSGTPQSDFFASPDSGTPRDE